MSLTVQTETVKPAIDRPLSRKLEDWLTTICWRLQEMPDRPRMTLQDFADALRTEFKLGIPLMPQITKFLAEMEIGLVWREKSGGLDASFDYNPLKSRWEIYIPSDLGLRESFAVMHEVSELVAWRCYYRIPWWVEWAQEEGCADPHKKADEFAFFMVLPSRKFRNQAKKHGYDLWNLATLCQTTPPLCFQALTRCVSFPYPIFHALFSVGALPEQLGMMFEEGLVPTKVLRKNYKKPTDDEVETDWGNLPHDQLSSWEAVEAFSSEAKTQCLPPKNQCFDLGMDDLIYQAKVQGQPLSATTDRIAGIPLDGLVDVIVTPKPDQPSLVYLQVLPAGFGKRFLAGKL